MRREAETQLPVRRDEGRFFPSFFEEDWWRSPFRWIQRIHEDLDQMLGEFFGPPERVEGAARWTPAMEVEETDNEWILRFELPGAEPEDIDVSVADQVLTVRAQVQREEERRERGFYRSERRYGRYERSVTLPRGAMADQIRASYRNGLLTIHVPKSPEARERVRPIPVETVPALAGTRGGEAGSPAGAPQPGAAPTQPPPQS